MCKNYFISFDIGASSGRTILGSVDDNTISLKELTRFANPLLNIGGHYYWNIYNIYEKLIEGLQVAAKQGVYISSIGIDTWGVDFVCVGEDGAILGLPFAYRDFQNSNSTNDFFKNVLSREAVYKLTGIQILNFNTIYQLHTLKQQTSSQLNTASNLLFIPDALNYMLTGNMATEYTIASTSQLLNPSTKQFYAELLRHIGINPDMFAKMVMPSTQIGILHRSIADECGLPQTPVIAVAGHDTASAVTAIPAQNNNFAYLSSGTWSLMGIEVDKPIINEQTYRLNITNEGGADGSTRLLKNITGMWILERCIKEWKNSGREYQYSNIVDMAQNAPTNHSYIDPDHTYFANPKSMIQAINLFCKETNQQKPESDAQYIRMIFESLALKYRYVLALFQELAPFEIERLHIIGGGSQNELLNQITANAIGLEVIAGPKEATAIGNIMLQAKAKGIVNSTREIRQCICNAVETKCYYPQEQSRWTNKYNIFTKILNHNEL